MCFGFITTLLEQIFIYSDENMKKMENDVPGEVVVVHTKDGVNIECCRVNGETKHSKTILLFHGNGGNLSTRRDLLSFLESGLDCNIVCFDYRGYGRSTGTPFEAGIMMDVEAVLDMMKAIYDPPYIFFGRSLGGSVASKAASLYPNLVSHLILDNAFESVISMTAPNLRILANPFLKNCWRTDRYLKEVNVPVMIIVSTEDEIVPPEHGERLFKACTSAEKRIVKIKAKHGDGPLKREYNPLIKDFIY